MRKNLIFSLLLVVALVSALPLTSFAQDDDMELVSPIPGGECTPDVAPEGDPIVVGGSLALTGPLAATGNIHRVAGQVFVDWVNECGGLLGRPLEWDLSDDATNPEQAVSIYTGLVESADLIVGPYAAANILAAAGPVGQAGRIYFTHTNGAPQQELGDWHFPSWQISGETPEEPWLTAAQTVFDALDSTGNAPENMFFMTAEFPTTISLVEGAREIAAESGIEEVDYITYPIQGADFNSIALRISAEDPDFIFVGGIGLDAVNLYNAFADIGYAPKGLYVALPAPGPFMASIPELEELLGTEINAMSLTIFENHAPFSEDPATAEFVTRFGEAAQAEELYSTVETQAAASFSMWQSMTAAVVATESLEDDVLKEWLLSNDIDVAAGSISFDGFNGYGTDFSRVVQIQDGERVIVWPPEFAAPDVEVIYSR